MRVFLVLGKPVYAPAEEASPRATLLEEPAPSVMDAGSSTASFFEMGCRQSLAPDLQCLARKPFGAIGDVFLVPRLFL